MKKQIENIFSFKKESKQKNIQLIQIDTREKNSLVPSYLFEKRVPLEFKKLNVGDYIIGEIIIERKEYNDFINAITSGRLKNQIIQLKQYKKKVIILERNQQKEIHSKINPHIINGTIIALTLHHAIPIIYTSGEHHTAQVLVQIAKTQPKAQPIQTKKIPKTYNEQRKYVLESFPGIGPKKAQELLDNYTSLNELFQTKDKKEILPKNVKENFTKILN